MKDRRINDVIISLENVSKGYSSGGNNFLALNNIDITICRNELVLILGPSGSGKTTILTIMAGLLPISSGRVLLYNEDIKKYSETAKQKFRANNIGFIFQNYLLIDTLTVMENILLAAKFSNHRKHIKEHIRALLSKLSISHLENKFPKDISHGEKQRAAIARAMINEADIILADEPTASLDWKHGHEVIDLLSRYSKENHKCVVIASHDLRIANFADRIITLTDGYIAE